MTYTIIGRCARTGQLGVGVATYSLAVGGHCPFIKAGVGAVSTQAFTNQALGPIALDLLERGLQRGAVLDELRARDHDIEYRQVGLIDADGHAAAFTGAHTRRYAGHVIGDGYVAMGNVLAGRQVIDAMAARFLDSEDQPLTERLLGALRAGQSAGGQRTEGGRSLNERSAALTVFGDADYPVLDLRVDVDESALDELERVLGAYQPYADYYELRRVRPAEAPPQDEWLNRRAQQD